MYVCVCGSVCLFAFVRVIVCCLWAMPWDSWPVALTIGSHIATANG